MSDPLRARAVVAVHAYRESGDRAHLEVLRQDGLRQLAHALSMEAAMPEDKRGRYTAEIDAWLGEGRA